MTPYMCRDLKERNVVSDLRILKKTWDGTKDSHAVDKATAYYCDVVRVRGISAKQFSGNIFSKFLGCLADQMTVRLEVELFPDDRVAGKQLFTTAPVTTVQGLGLHFSPVERMAFAYTSKVDKKSAEDGASTKNPMATDESMMQSKMMRKKSMRSAMKLKISMKSKKSKRLIGVGVYDLSLMQPGEKFRNLEVELLNVQDGTTVESIISMHIECKILREAIHEEFQSVVQYQRYDPFNATGPEFGRNFLLTDPNGGKCDYSNINATIFGQNISSVCPPVPDGYVIETDWVADTAGGDAEGWCYGSSFMDMRWTEGKDLSSYVRRRGWIRTLREIGENETMNEAIAKVALRKSSANENGEIAAATTTTISANSRIPSKRS
jgi:hypothetical protein